jgi:hypothetical protein
VATEQRIAVDLRGHYSNLPTSNLRPPKPSAEWCKMVHDLHELLIQPRLP